MAKKLTSVENTWKQAVLHDIFEAGGLIKLPIRTAGVNYVNKYQKSDGQVLCDEIKYRSFKFYDTDGALRRIANNCYFFDLRDRDVHKRLVETQIANIIAAFCAENEIFWDDVNTHKTTVEMDTYRKSILGNACWEFGCFLSQQSDKGPSKYAAKFATKRGSGTKSKASTTSSSPRSGVPKSGYKSSGGKSGEIKGLIGEPGEKIDLTSTCTYMGVILCLSSKSKAQYAFVDPLANKVDPNKVKLGDPSGYSSCKLFFASERDAYAAIDKIKSSIAIPDHITGFEIRRQAVDRNGYFKINTEIGPAYIKASKLNEAVAEELDKEVHQPKSRYPEINDVDVYTEAMFQYE
jgi:hypothetical protein